MKKKLQNAIASIEARLKTNTLSETATALWEEVKAAFEALAAEDTEHDITALNDKYAEISAKYAEQNEQVAERIQALRNELMAKVQGEQKIADKFTKEVREEIARAISENAGSSAKVQKAVMEVCKRNDITGMTFADIQSAAVVFESKPTALFDLFGRTSIEKHYLVGIDESNAAQIAKQWTDSPTAVKEVEELAAEGVTINTKYVYKQQRMANEVIDNARVAGTLAQVESEISRELEQQVKRLAERAAIVGDTINASGNRVTTFQTIGNITQSTARVSVLNPTTANTINMVEIARTADAVEGEPSEKVLVIGKDAARALSTFTYGQGGTATILSDEDLAAKIGVSRIIKVDYISAVSGLHAVVLKPSAYKVYVKNEVRVAYPKHENNSLYYLYELNMGGALTELKSAAILREA